jgi:peptidoglycan-N-acetylglucosamine deacetylase
MTPPESVMNSSEKRRPRRRAAFLIGLAILIVATASFGVAEGVHIVRNGRYGGLSPICRVETDRRVVALTFDDGPDAVYTPAVLALLNTYGDRATFFVVGKHARQFPDLVADESDAGMEIGDHTWSHAQLPTLSQPQANSEILRPVELLLKQGIAVRFFRAPLGEITPSQLAATERLGLKPIHWSIAVDHYVGGLGLTAEEAASALLRDIQPGDIILAHDDRLPPQDGGAEREAAMATLALLLPALQQQGYAVMTVGQLLQQGASVRGDPRIWFWQAGFTCP